jgi:hypothetical protein
MAYKNPLKKKINMSEFQRVVACVAYESCAKDLTVAQHQDAIYNCVHGKGDNASQIQLLIDGTNIRYKNIYQDVNCPQVGNCSPINKRIVKPIYSPNRGEVELCIGKEMTYENLRYSTLNGKTLIPGRTLHCMALLTFQYGKKALAYAHAFLDSSKNLPSGEKEHDLLNHVLDEMYKEEIQGKKKIIDVLDEEGASVDHNNDSNVFPEATPSEKRPDDWVFPGYVAFCLFGCPIITEESKRLANFTTGGETESKRSARQVIRKQDANRKKEIRSFEAAEFGDRGSTLEHNFQAATLRIQSISARQQDLAETRKRYHGDMMVLQGQHGRLVAEREQAIRLAEMYSKTDNKERVTSYLDDVENLGQDIKNVRKQMNNALENQSNKTEAMEEKDMQLQHLLDYETTPRKIPRMCAGSPITIGSGLSIGASTAAFTTAAAEESSNNDDVAHDTSTPGLHGYKAPCAAGKYCKNKNWLLYPECFVLGTKNPIHSCIECSLGMHANCNIVHQSEDTDIDNLNLLCLKCKEKQSNQ